MNACDCGRPSVHPARHLTHGGKSACIDEDLVELVLLMWRLGINTSESCQHEPDEDLAVYLMPSELERWVDLMLAGGDDEIYFRVFDSDDSRPGWRITVSAGVIEEDESVVTSPPDEVNDIPMYKATRVALGLGVYFPREDLPDVMLRLRQVARNAVAV